MSSSRVRLLPTLIGTAGVLLCFKIGAMAANPEPAASDSPPAASAGVADATATGEPKAEAAVAEHVPEPEKASGAAPEAAPEEPSQSYAGLAQTKGEADVLQKLADRRAVLDARERDLGLREQLLLAAEKQIDSRLTELKALEQRLEVMMTKRNEQEEAQIVSLVKTYETMKPEDAARIFNRLDRSILVDVSSRMKPAKVGAIMASMDPARAQELTVMLAKRLKVSQNQAAQTVAPPPQPVSDVGNGVPASDGSSASGLPSARGEEPSPDQAAAPHG